MTYWVRWEAAQGWPVDFDLLNRWRPAYNDWGFGNIEITSYRCRNEVEVARRLFSITRQTNTISRNVRELVDLVLGRFGREMPRWDVSTDLVVAVLTETRYRSRRGKNALPVDPMVTILPAGSSLSIKEAWKSVRIDLDRSTSRSNLVRQIELMAAVVRLI